MQREFNPKFSPPPGWSNPWANYSLTCCTSNFLPPSITRRHIGYSYFVSNKTFPENLDKVINNLK
uniref:Uncharacterized protein n=1 Tax=Rhizophora mucronata TaxID=61149 RepID=A0A2P2QME2_RHIMU